MHAHHARRTVNLQGFPLFQLSVNHASCCTGQRCDGRRKVYGQKKSSGVDCETASVESSRQASALHSVRFIHRKRRTYSHQAVTLTAHLLSHQPNRCLTTLEAELSCSVIAPPLHTHTAGALFTAVSHILLTQSIMVAEMQVLFSRPNRMSIIVFIRLLFHLDMIF